MNGRKAKSEKRSERQKNVNTEVKRIVDSIREFFDRLENMKNNYENAARNYKPDSALMIGEVSQAEKDYNDLYNGTEGYIAEQLDALRAKVEEDRKNSYKACEDMQLLSAPVTLEKRDLDILVDKHKDNYLFVRAAYEYAEKHGITLDHEELALVNPFDARLTQIERLKDVTKSCMSGATFLKGVNAIGANRQYFSLMVTNGYFDKLNV